MQNKWFNTNQLKKKMNFVRNTQHIIWGEKETQLANNKPQQRSMLPIDIDLSQFPLIGIHISVDIYAIFRFGPMHLHLIGISKLLKECLVLNFSDRSWVFSAMRYRSSQPNSICAMRKSVLKLFNELLKIAEEYSIRNGAQMVFSKIANGGKRTWLFTETGILGKLEAKGLKNINFFSPLLGDAVHICCYNTKDAPVTHVFT